MKIQLIITLILIMAVIAYVFLIHARKKRKRPLSSLCDPKRPTPVDKLTLTVPQPLVNKVPTAKYDQSTPTAQVSLELDRYFLDIVDLLDEIGEMKKVDEKGSKMLEIIESRLITLIKLSDGDLIRDLDWQPDLQRAVEVMPGSHNPPKILSTRRSGLTVSGRVVRKQEVVLSKSKQSN